ncbi:expressed unknown protein [Seminavis robusta]|uniref:Uncharacterized protein n=1 Tax=Seminavis robusta TaxID=568900 RepID=A0A9N8ERD2_9STRA|nr:expressed unknown protein [Seminavis robusta]|eukprot:Sro1473_g275580.1 n/a (223) ;mRNA; r:4910-5652
MTSDDMLSSSESQKKSMGLIPNRDAPAMDAIQQQSDPMQKEPDFDRLAHLARPRSESYSESIAALRAFRQETMDISAEQRTSDPMFEKKYDDEVVQVALRNYEAFHGMEQGTASCYLVGGTSAGIHGWAACSSRDVPSAPLEKDSALAMGKQRMAASSYSPPTTRHKGDTEESQMIMMAMLESAGVCRSHGGTTGIDVAWQSDYREESYHYEDDDDYSDDDD